jgi:hypothetical protein
MTSHSPASQNPTACWPFHDHRLDADLQQEGLQHQLIDALLSSAASRTGQGRWPFRMANLL